MTPLDPSFSIAMIETANRSFPSSFDASSQAPATHKELKAFLEGLYNFPQVIIGQTQNQRRFPWYHIKSDAFVRIARVMPIEGLPRGNEDKIDKAGTEDLPREALKSVAEYFHERGRDVPPVVFTAYYGRHTTREEAEHIVELVQEADIVFPEYIGWDLLPTELTQKPGQESDASRATNFADFADQLFEAIRRENKPVGFLDIPATDELYQHLIAADDSLFEEPRRDIKAARSFHEVAEKWKKSVDRWTDIQREREQYMLSHIALELDRILAEHPELAGKDALHVLLVLGAVHTNIGHVLQRRGDLAGSRFSESPFVFQFTLAQAARARTINGDIPEHLYQRSLTEFLVLDTLDVIPRSYEMTPEELDRVASQIGKLMTFEDTERLYDARTQGNEQTTAFLADLVARHGLFWPETREALGTFLAST